MTPDAPRPSILPLELDGVSFVAASGKKRLLKDITCSFPADAATAIIGPNGAGKSLLLRVCHGLVKPTAGDVRWTGANGTDPAKSQAMVFQRPIMLRRSVAANVDYALKLRGMAKPERTRRIDEVLGFTGLRRFATAPARVLSFGEQQKLALARAWALRPEVLFLDEPTASLDPSATYAIEQIVAQIRAGGTRILMTTHDLGQAKRLADEIVFMYRGRILEKAPAAEFFAGPKNDLAQAFLRGELLWWRSGKDDKREPKYRN